MERKTKHRILGILVLIGLVVILLPFFQTNKDLPSEKMLVKAPPFPDQATQLAQDAITPDEVQSQVTPSTSMQPVIASTQDNRDEQPDDTIPNSNRITPLQVANNVQPVSSSDSHEAKIAESTNFSNKTIQASTVNNKVKTTVETIETPKSVKNSDTNVPQQQSVSKTENIVAPKIIETHDQQPSANRPSLSPDDSDDSEEDDTAIATEKTNKISNVSLLSRDKNLSASSHTKAIKNIHIAHLNKTFVPKVIEYKDLVEPLTSDGLSRLRNSAWVIQVGSFKSKVNAVRLVNQLRAKGYRAFIQQVSTPVGNTTRVFVGPELKQEHARVTADNIESSLRIHGIVISYKPLAL